VHLATLFSLDAFGGGFVIQSLLALWLFRRFNMSIQAAGVFFFAAGLLGSLSQFVSIALAARIGRIRTMVYTHVPSNAFLILAAMMPSAKLTLVFLLLRSSLSQMDVPARQSYVMAVVPPEERAAAASVTNVPQPRRSSGSDSCWGDVGRLVLGVAVDLRRCAEGPVRLPPLASVPFG
jgi:predicted MFS family arabinose efflux permease